MTNNTTTQNNTTTTVLNPVTPALTFMAPAIGKQAIVALDKADKLIYGANKLILKALVIAYEEGLTLPDDLTILDFISLDGVADKTAMGFFQDSIMCNIFGFTGKQSANNPNGYEKRHQNQVFNNTMAIACAVIMQGGIVDNDDTTSIGGMKIKDNGDIYLQSHMLGMQLDTPTTLAKLETNFTDIKVRACEWLVANDDAGNVTNNAIRGKVKVNKTTAAADNTVTVSSANDTAVTNDNIDAIQDAVSMANTAVTTVENQAKASKNNNVDESQLIRLIDIVNHITANTDLNDLSLETRQALGKLHATLDSKSEAGFIPRPSIMQAAPVASAMAH